MSSGIPNAIKINNVHVSQQFLPFQSLATTCGRHITKPLLFKPGDSTNPDNNQYYYSNAAFECASYLVVKISGAKGFEDYIYQNIVRPLGLTTSFKPYDQAFGIDENRPNEFYQYIIADDPTQSYFGKVSEEFSTGSASGAGGLVASPLDERTLYFELFNFSAERKNSGSVILSYDSILELVTPRTLIQKHSDFVEFYSLGLFVNAIPITSRKFQKLSESVKRNLPPPTPNGLQVNQILYEGEIMGAHTANLLDLSYFPYAMAQLFTTTIVMYPTKKQFEKVKQRGFDGGNFWEVTNDWQQQTGLLTMCEAVIELFQKN